MKFITCASYYGVGSSAVTDYVSEFSSVFSFTNEEFRFIQDPDGISDLEFNLVECFNRHNSGHSLKRYKKLVDFYAGNFLLPRYQSFFRNKWKELSYQYIRELTDFTYPGWWFYDLYDRGEFYLFRKRLINKLLHKTIWRNQPDRVFNTMKDEITYCSHPSEEKFLQCTKDYIYRLFESVKPKNIDTIMVDQLVPPTNLSRYLRYFDNNIKVVVVDRDPRDIFFLDKYIWKDGILPSNVEIFCKWFRYTWNHRKCETMNSEQIKFVQFEDLVYKYDDATNDLREWLGLDETQHSSKLKFFNPSISIHNTQVWKQFSHEIKEKEFIERELSEYLYDFPMI